MWHRRAGLCQVRLRQTCSCSEVGRNRQLVAAVGGDPEAPPALGTNALQSYELLRPGFAYRDAARHQLAPDTRPAVATPRLGVKGLDVYQQRLIAQVAPLRIKCSW